MQRSLILLVAWLTVCLGFVVGPHMARAEEARPNVLIVMAWRLLPSGGSAAQKPFDWAGAIALTVLLSAFAVGITNLDTTNLGERLFQPDIGTNIRRLLFENIDEITAGMTKGIVTQAIERWLGHRVVLDELNVEAEESEFSVTVRYRIAGTADTRILILQKTGI